MTTDPIRNDSIARRLSGEAKRPDTPAALPSGCRQALKIPSSESPHWGEHTAKRLERVGSYLVSIEDLDEKGIFEKLLAPENA